MTVDAPPSACSAGHRLGGVLAWLLLALCALPFPAGATPAPITVTDSTALPLQVERMELLRDPTRELDLAQVRASDSATGFTPAAVGVPNLGVGRDAVWVRFAVRNATSQRHSLLLALADPRTGHVAFWALDDAGQVIAARRDGRLADPAERDRAHRWFLFDLPLAADSTVTVYLRVTSDTGRRLDLRLTDRLRLAQADRHVYGWLGLFLGALLFMLAYNLLLLAQLRDPAYLWLCCLIAGGIIWIMEREGLLTTLAWPLWPHWLSGIAAGPAVALIGIFLFPVAYLRLAQHAPRWVRLHYALVLLAASLPVLVLWHPQLSFMLNSALGLIAAPTMMTAALLVVRRQPRAVGWYLVSWLPLLATMLLLTPMNYGWLPALPAVWGLPYLGAVLMLLMLSVAQADRTNDLRRQAEHAQAALVQNEARLADLVDERTRELATARDRAEAASRAKTQFLANMSHELRTPLNAVLGGVDLLRGSPRLGAEERHHCGLIQRGGRHLLRLIEDLLDIASIEHNRLRPVLGEVALHPLLEDLAALTRRQAEAKGLAFDLDLAANLPLRVRTDARRLRQVLQNLLDNAVKYTDAGGVSLTAERDPLAPASVDDGTLTLLFTVTDTGRGIADADRERLFAPFEQYHHAQAGSGLGLAICRELAGVLSGELQLDSTPGRGSRFCLRLPVQRVTAAPQRRETERPHATVVGDAGPRRRILVIDDSEVNRVLMAGLLGQLGFDVDTAEDADTAVAIARREPPDLLIVDMRMPKMCGYAAAWMLRDALARPDLPVIAASASPLPAPGDAAELGFDAFLLKPLDQEMLRAAIEDCLRLRCTEAGAGSPSIAGAADSTLSPLLPPPRSELAAALELAERGDWVALRGWCAQLAAATPDCAGFAGRALALLEAIRGPAPDTAIRALQRLLADAGRGDPRRRTS
jgi:signal transduction histidine kinase/DNA-binding NarL/FixJ family response regulator